MSEIPCDVVVVGAGPTGLTLAGDLARLGRSVTVLEKWPTMNPSSRAFAAMPRTMELLASRGLAGDLLANSHLAPGVALFAGARIDLRHLDGSAGASPRKVALREAFGVRPVPSPGVGGSVHW